MRDLKQVNKPVKKVRRNRARKERKPLDLRSLFRRGLRLAMFLFCAALLIVGGFLGSQLLLTSETFDVEQVQVEGAQRLPAELLIALSNIGIGVNSFKLDLDLIGRKIAENPWIRSANVQRIFPSTIVIQVEEREPVAVINLDYLYYLDRHAEVFKVLEADDNLDYPVVTGFDYGRAQGHDEAYAEQLQDIVALLDDLSHRQLFNLKKLSEIHVEERGAVTLYTLAGGARIKLGRNDFSHKLDRLERIYPQLEAKLSALDYIDLNVKEKVIVRIEQPNKAART